MMQESHGARWNSQTYLPDSVVKIDGAEPQVRLRLMGRFKSIGRFRYEQISRSLAVHVIASGSGTMVADGKHYAVEAGDLFAFYPGSHYRYWDDADNPWRYTWFVLAGPAASTSLALAGLTPQRPHVQGGFAAPLEPLFEEIAQVLIAGVTPTAFPMSAAWRLIDTIQRRGGEPAMDRNVAELARTLLDGHFTCEMTVEELARQLEISRSTLFRKFRDAYGVSPKQYQDSARMQRAKRLLQQSPGTVKEIARACGYEDSHYFSRAYRRVHGKAPGEDRQP